MMHLRDVWEKEKSTTDFGQVLRGSPRSFDMAAAGFRKPVAFLHLFEVSLYSNPIEPPKRRAKKVKKLLLAPARSFGHHRGWFSSATVRSQVSCRLSAFTSRHELEGPSNGKARQAL